MARINYTASSPYSSTKQTSWHISNYVHRSIPPASDDKSVALTKNYEFRPDKLSNDLYGTPAYWWVFAVRNRSIITDPIWDMTVGTVIVIPSPATIKKVLG